MNVSVQAFRRILQEEPALCARGLAESVGSDCQGASFELERRILEESFDEFAVCCDWLLDCTPLKHVSFVSPVSSDLLGPIEKESGRSVSNGALIAAVLHMRIPHRPLAGSCDVRVGISLRSPALEGAVLQGKK
jgi:hypothetical protein